MCSTPLSRFARLPLKIITVLSGLLPGRESGAPTSASAICINSIMLAFAIPLGLSNAASARVGVVLGAGRPEAARLAGTVAFGVALAVESAVAFSLLFVGGDRFAELFAGSGEDGAPTRDAFRTLVPPLALILFGDGLQATLSGVVRGAGLQATALKLNLLSFYAIGLPLGVALAFGPPRAGLVGLWSGVALAVIMQFFLLGSLLNGLRWDERARAADDAAKHGPGEAVGGEAGAGAGGEDDDDDEDGF